VPAERGGAANLNGAHNAQLLKRQPALLAVEFAVGTENIGQLKGWPGHA